MTTLYLASDAVDTKDVLLEEYHTQGNGTLVAETVTGERLVLSPSVEYIVVDDGGDPRD